jgi:hypothetical protein
MLNVHSVAQYRFQNVKGMSFQRQRFGYGLSEHFSNKNSLISYQNVDFSMACFEEGHKVHN